MIERNERDVPAQLPRTEREPGAEQRPFGYATLRASPESDSEFLPTCSAVCYAHLSSTLGVGRGLRLNNPYRLRTQLGSGPESLSLTAPYTDVALAALFGDPGGFQQGVIVSASFAMAGVPQQVLAPGYAALYRLGPRGQLRGHVALPVVLQPDTNAGLDVAIGGAFFLFSGLGLAASGVFSLYEGAATDQRAATLVPVLSLELGVTVDYEVLP
jgi:hypothetical protein